MSADLLLNLFGAFVVAVIIAALVCEEDEHPDVKPWFHDESEGEYSDDPEDGYPYDE